MNSAVEWGNAQAAMDNLRASQLPYWDGYLGFYSSWLKGYFREPWAMLMPFDDHGFHRGDGVFEAVRLHDGAYFDLQSHLRRLKKSAAYIGMELPSGVDEIQAICVRLAHLCASPSGVLRLYVTRGPGSFSQSPKEVIGHQIYAAITKMKVPAATVYENGCRAMFSTVPAKDPFWSQVKSCNYLQNVLMKKECLDRDIDFAVSIGENGRLCEGSTESMFLVSESGELIVPKFDYTLRGTTIQVVMRLADALLENKTISAVRFGDLRKEDLLGAREAAFVGTTMGVLPMSQIEGHSIGSGKAGPVAKFLQTALMDEMSKNSRLRTVF